MKFKYWLITFSICILIFGCKARKIDNTVMYYYYVPAGTDWKPKEIELPDLFRLHYSIHETQTRPYVVESNGDHFFVGGGPPFLFQIFLYDVKSNVKFIQLKQCLLINFMENNLLKTDDISIEYEITFPDKNYNETVGMIEKEVDYNQFYTNGIFYKDSKIEELILKQKENGIDTINQRRGGIVFRNIPIDYLNDENILLKAEFIITIEDSKEKIFFLDEKYIRKDYRK